MSLDCTKTFPLCGARSATQSSAGGSGLARPGELPGASTSRSAAQAKSKWSGRVRRKDMPATPATRI